jgi:NAD-dependent DNA ligase
VQLLIPIAEDDEDEPAPPVKTVDAPHDISGKMLLITGAIDGHTRASAQKLLEAEGAKFAKSLNKQVELVVLGANPGPDKMKAIADMGIGTVKWEDLVQGLGLPVGGEPPKKKSKR